MYRGPVAKRVAVSAGSASLGSVKKILSGVVGIGVGAQIGIGIQSAKNVVSGILLAKVRTLVVIMNEEVGALVLTLPNSVPGIRFSAYLPVKR